MSVAEINYLRIDPHVHVLDYDARENTPSSVGTAASRRGLHAIGVVNHDRIPPNQTLDIINQQGVVAIPGIEASFRLERRVPNFGHLVVLFDPDSKLPDWPFPQPEWRDGLMSRIRTARLLPSLSEVIDAGIDLGGVAIVAHPHNFFWWGCISLTELIGWRRDNMNVTPLGVEFNAAPIHGIMTRAITKIATRLKLTRMGASDAHVPWHIGQMATEVKAEPPARKPFHDLRKAVIAGTTKVVGKHLTLDQWLLRR